MAMLSTQPDSPHLSGAPLAPGLLSTPGTAGNAAANSEAGLSMASADSPCLCSAGHSSWHRGLSAWTLGESQNGSQIMHYAKGITIFSFPWQRQLAPMPNHIPSAL
jgi:hypothetical protein